MQKHTHTASLQLRRVAITHRVEEAVKLGHAHDAELPDGLERLDLLAANLFALGKQALR